MPKFKNLFGLLGNNGGGGGQEIVTAHTNGRLETDALPVDDAEDDNANRRDGGRVQEQATPTASVEMTESVVRELSDPNYNSMDLVPVGVGGALVEAGGAAGALVSADSSTSNTMNVHNAQQQVNMSFNNISKLHFGSVFNFNAGAAMADGATSSNASGAIVDGGAATSYSKPRSAALQKTTSVVLMMQSQEELNHRMLDTIATHLGEGWKQVMRDLGHSEGQIEQALIDHHLQGNLKEVIYQLLLQWQRNADDGVATLGYMTTLLWKSNYRDIVQRMKLVWKAETKRKTSR